MKIYKYANTEYKTAQEVRHALWEGERKAFGVCNTEADWAKHGVTVVEKEVVLTEEQLASQARAKRNRLLQGCDYYLMPDYPSTKDGVEAVKAYRQALRDITKQEGFPNEIVWPDVPEVLQ